MHVSTTTLTLASLFITSSLALPTSSPTLHPRAGGPIGQPITNCTLTTTYPNFCNWGLGFVPSSSFVSSSLLYSYILSESYQLAPSEEVLLTNCLETCHGYGDLNECQSVFFAYEFPSLPVGSEERALGTEMPAMQQAGCVLFGAPIAEGDLVEPEVGGTYRSARAVDIVCPS